jgi:eukaryotic-like serine/threonine-protein kinase
LVELAHQHAAFEGTQLGRYRLRYSIAKGGMASVYLAQLAGAYGFEQWVAVKVMHPHLAADRRFATMFLDEARVTSKIRHPNVCSILDFGEDRRTPYIVMEYLHGETLSKVVRRGREERDLPLWVPARAIADAARGLHAAHELRGPDGKLRNLVHRDVSPQNILVLYDGIAKIMDFGVVLAEDRLTSTISREVKGRWGYMAPEQLRGEPLDRRSDVWSLGVLLWEASVGQRLFRAENPAQTAIAVVQGDIPDPRDLVPDLPAELADVIHGALQRDQTKRTASARELADGIERFLHKASYPFTADQLGEWMNHAFSDRRKRREEILNSSESGEMELYTPSFSMLGETSLGGPNQSGVVPSDKNRKAAALPRWIFAIPIAGVLLLALCVAIGYAIFGGEPDQVAMAPAPSGGREEALELVRSGTIEPSAPLAPPTAPEVQPTAEPAPPPIEEETIERRPRGPGTLNLLAIPPAEVFLGARRLGRTPLIGVSLPSGTHRLRLVAGETTRTVPIVIRAGQRTSRSVNLRSSN